MMIKRRRDGPNNLKNIVHDRTSHDFLHNAQVTPIEVDDPYEEGAKIVVLQSTRHDPLAEIISKGQIDQCDYVAGRHWQAAWENAEIGSVRAIDPTREAVDCGSLPEMLTDTQRRAVQDLKAAREALGQEGHQLICDVPGRGMLITQAARNRGLWSETDRKYARKRFSRVPVHAGDWLRLRQPGGQVMTESGIGDLRNGPSTATIKLRSVAASLTCPACGQR